jgi:hypothetical protein
VLVVKNPVYPFMYERFGGANWDERRATIYRREQDTFGIGRTNGKVDPKQVGHGILGLAYQPGRYVNPGQESGFGSPLGAIGVAILSGLVLWPLSGRGRRFEGFILATSGLALVAWFFISQQSRYIAALAPSSAILVGGAVATLGLGRLVAGIVALQSLFTVYLFQKMKFSDQVQVVLGKVSPEEYQTTHIPFYEAAVYLNKNVPRSQVALYDEVFGFLLDVPYMWANPGHSTIIPYDGMTNTEQYVREMKRLGFTHVYINLSRIVKSPEFVKIWLPSMGLQGAPVPMPDDIRKLHYDNWETKWEILLADSIAEGKIRPTKAFKSGILFEIE